MKKSIKKVLTLLLCAVISMSAFTLFGCGGEDTGGVDIQSDVQGSEQKPIRMLFDEREHRM